MPKTLADVKTALTALPNGNELYEVVAGLSGEKETAISEREEAKKGLSTLHSTHNKLVDGLKTVGYAGGDAVSFLGELKAKIEKLPELETQVTQSGQKLTAEQQRMTALETQIGTLSKNLQAEQTKGRNNTLRDAVQKKVSERIFGAPLHIQNLIQTGRVVLKDDNSIVAVKDGAEVPLDQGLETYFQEHKDDLKNVQAGGSGATGAPGSRAPNAKTMPRDTFEKLSPAEQSKYLLVDGGRVV